MCTTPYLLVSLPLAPDWASHSFVGYGMQFNVMLCNAMHIHAEAVTALRKACLAGV